MFDQWAPMAAGLEDKKDDNARFIVSYGWCNSLKGFSWRQILEFWWREITERSWR
jgi:hypothetical protein